jgi:hypothetical protein
LFRLKKMTEKKEGVKTKEVGQDAIIGVPGGLIILKPRLGFLRTLKLLVYIISSKTTVLLLSSMLLKLSGNILNGGR